MTDDPSPSANPDPGRVDHPGQLGDLTDVFLRRLIAAGIDAAGQIFLARPNSIVADAGMTGDRRDVIARIVGKFDPEQAKRIAGADVVAPGGLTRIDLKTTDPNLINRELRWSLEGASTMRADLLQAGVPSDFNYVFIGEQSFVGHPLGANASRAGELAFAGKTSTNASGVKTILTTAEPTNPPAFLRSSLRIDDHRPPRVLVLDTGLRTADGAGVEPEHEALTCCTVRGSWVSDPTVGAPDDEDEPDDDRSGTLDFEAGHGTFISGIIQQLCPDAMIDTAGVLSSFGEGDVSSVLAALQRVTNPNEPFDIVVMSFGGFFANDDASLFEPALNALLGNAIGIAAAGNNFTCRPCYPAALKDIIAVGGLGADGKAWFTNFGGWVDACAPAVDVVSTFFKDFSEMIDGEEYRRYEGWARWSGTSFSAPKVAAVIAQEMYLNQVSAKEAWKRVTSHKHLRYPDLGIVFNV